MNASKLALLSRSPNYKQNSPQYQWLFNDLNSVNRQAHTHHEC